MRAREKKFTNITLYARFSVKIKENVRHKDPHDSYPSYKFAYQISILVSYLHVSINEMIYELCNRFK